MYKLYFSRIKRNFIKIKLNEKDLEKPDFSHKTT